MAITGCSTSRVSQRLSKFGLVALSASVIGLSGCSQVNRMGANIALGFTEKFIVPSILTLDDTNMACESSNSLAPAIVAAEDMGADAAKIETLIFAGAALCAEQNALEQELRYLRAADKGNVEEAQDARILQKRYAQVAGERQLLAYNKFSAFYESEYNFRIGEDCPKLRDDFTQTIYMLGLISGLQAIQSDAASGGAVSVSKDIAAKVERGMECLDNEKFWGVPMATRAAIWTLLPGADAGKPEPYKVMNQQAKLGKEKGVRLAYAIRAMAASASGEDEKIRMALKEYGQTIGETQVDPRYRLFDKMGYQIIMNISDRYWTENTGQRTPENGLNKYWDEQAAEPDIGIDLDDIL